MTDGNISSAGEDVQGQGDGSMGKGACLQAWPLELDAWTLVVAREDSLLQVFL